MDLDRALEYIDASLPACVRALQEFVRIPSISAGAHDLPAAAAGIRQAAAFLVDRLGRAGLNARQVQLGPQLNPVVIAAKDAPDPDRPTVLYYGHYDVQGVDNPLSAWSYEPFCGDCRDGYVLGRGASDDKGQLLAHVHAWSAVAAAGGKPPINPVFLFEGEEECGSEAIRQLVAAGELSRYGPFLCVVVSDSSMLGPDRPSLTLGLRGILFTELTVSGPRQDLHSGLAGGLVPNPNNVLVRALATLADERGRVLLPGFYDDIAPLGQDERAAYAGLPQDDEEFRRSLGAPWLQREPGCTLLEQRWVRPSFDIHHLAGGSPRTVIPARASAALSFRLVPNQDPEAVRAALETRLGQCLPPGYALTLGRTHACRPYHLPIDHPLVGLALQALRTGFGVEPGLSREGGSIPIVLDLASATAAPVLLLGFGQVTDNWHGPDEHLCVRDFHRGIRASAALMERLGRQGAQRPAPAGCRSERKRRSGSSG